MKKLIYCLFLFCSITLSSCSDGTTSRKEPDARPTITSSGEVVIPESAISAAKDVIRHEFSDDAHFVDDECVAYATDVPGRYRVEGRFSSANKDYSSLVFGIYIQKFDTGWEYGHFIIQNDYDGEYVLRKNGNMKKMESEDGVGDIITAGGIDFTVAEKKPRAVRIYTEHKLSRSQLKAAIVDLMPKYETIHFATTAKHERGEEYAGWLNDMFFDFEADEIINKAKFLQ